MSHPRDQGASSGPSSVARPRDAGGDSATRLGELFVAMRSGSDSEREAAWSSCYAEYRQLVWTRVFYVIRTIPWLTEPREVAEDVTSDVFVGLPDAVRLYRDEGKPEQWLKQVAVRTALRARERLTGEWKKRDPGAGPPAGSRRFASFDDEANHIVAQLDEVQRDEVMELERRIARLRESDDPRQRRWAEFVDLYREGYGFAEIGERLGITEGTARNWLVAIRKELAATPDSSDGDE